MTKPSFVHDCSRCTFVGRTTNGEEVYFCVDSIIRRYGDDGPEYYSFPVEIAEKVVSFAEAISLVRLHKGEI